MRYLYCLFFILISSMNISLFAMKRGPNELESSSAVKKPKHKLNLHTLLEDLKLDDIKKVIESEEADVNEVISIDGYTQPFLNSLIDKIDIERTNRWRDEQNLFQDNNNIQAFKEKSALIQNIYSIAIQVAASRKFNPETIDSVSPSHSLVNRLEDNKYLDRREQDLLSELDFLNTNQKKINDNLLKEFALEQSLNMVILKKSVPTINKKCSGLSALHRLVYGHRWDGTWPDLMDKLTKQRIDSKNIFLASQFLAVGANPNIKSDSNKTPLDLCVYFNQEHRSIPTRDESLACLLMLNGGISTDPNTLKRLGFNREKSDFLYESFQKPMFTLSHSQRELYPKNIDSTNIFSVISAREQRGIKAITIFDQQDMSKVYADFVIERTPWLRETAPSMFDYCSWITDVHGNEGFVWYPSDLFR